jgi:hypothetical protein
MRGFLFEACLLALIVPLVAYFLDLVGSLKWSGLEKSNFITKLVR